MVTRVPIFSVRPWLEGGRHPVKAVVAEPFTVRARIFGEGRAFIAAAVILTGPDGVEREPIAMHHLGNDHWSVVVTADIPGAWTFRVESWHDLLVTWRELARLRIAAGVDIELTLREGAALLEQTGVTQSLLDGLTDPGQPGTERLAAAVALAIGAELRENVDSTGPHPVFVDRERALVGAWYEMFPRSEGATRVEYGSVRPGTFATATARLDEIAAMGFDVVYLPPIHPIGRLGRKGRNNALAALPEDPGSPWAIGAAEGGHDAVHPELGTLEDFDAFVAHARSLGMEVALDLALQCSPDHPWVAEHPEWFTTRLDGTIAFAENPPKKYEDIYPLTFDEDPVGLYVEVRRVIRHWMNHGVRIFRVDNPHTKPVAFWEQLLGDIRDTDPDVVFLSEAFTTPAMLHALAMVGFHQSYTYFTWRDSPAEMSDYLDEVSQRTADFMRPNFFVNTPDILPTYLQTGDRAMFLMRAGLAATASPSWGMYAGYELLEHRADGPGSEEYLNSEKYEIKLRDWRSPESIAPFITRLNEIRRRHPALRRLRNLYIVPTDQPSVVCFAKILGDDLVLVVVDMRPAFDKTVQVRLDLQAYAVAPDTRWCDEVDGSAHDISGVPVSPEHPVRILVPES